MHIISIKIHNFRSISECTLKLADYSLLIGANNAGKSNVMDVLRIFYEKGLKYESSRDFPKFETDDRESWMEIEYKLSDDEYTNLKDEWRQPENTLKIHKNFETSQKGSDGKIKLGIYAYNQEGQISNDYFYGAKNVQQGKLGNIIFIPAASKLDEHTKLTGPSPLRELINDILKKLIKTSGAFKKLTAEFQLFSKGIKEEETDENKSLLGLEEDITSSLTEWDAKFELDVAPVTEADIVKNLISYKIVNTDIDERMEASQFGQGFQRHLIFTLIRTAAKYQAPSTPLKKKEFKPDLTVLLFEEPEVFLHPIQQSILCRSLKTVGSTDGQQVLISSHSPYFVSHHTDDLPSIIRLNKQSHCTNTGQIDSITLKEIFVNNRRINDLIAAADDDDFKEEMETVKYFLWLNSERCGIFFAQQVLLVEGATERVLLNYLFDIGKLEMPNGGVFVLDCFGKYNIHRFMNLLEPFKINHSVLFDGDGDTDVHKLIRTLIDDSKNRYTRKIDRFTSDIESFLDIEKSAQAHRKPQHVMFKVMNGQVSEEKIVQLIDKVNALIVE